MEPPLSAGDKPHRKRRAQGINPQLTFGEIRYPAEEQRATA
jgi:hypothetical protein